jgi:UDP-N-acetylmuramoyl-tripeptide--D-alanyl-D-alanine ligase
MNAAPITEPTMDRLAHLARVTDGQLVGSDQAFIGISTDSRKLRSGELYVALSGERFDGHQFVEPAARQGAVAAVVERQLDSAMAQVIVPDALRALQVYASHWRNRFDIPVIGVTGSNGKTTTKEMLSAICSQRGPVLATLGNLNNHIGVPLTLLRLRAEHQSAVIEMGANHQGEIAQLTRLAQPGVAVITQAGLAHIEGFGGREGIARGKGEIFAGLSANGLAVINADDDYADMWRQLAAHCQQLSFGLDAVADVTAHAIREISYGGDEHIEFELETPQGSAQVSLPMLGRHNVMNALAAAACALGAGFLPAEIARGLGAMRSVSGRLVRRDAIQGAHVIDDTYNANPTSLAAALDLLARLPTRRWLVLGDMGELGAESSEWHRKAGEWARARDVERLFAVGPLSRDAVKAFGEGAEHFTSHTELTVALASELRAGITVLVKGSRSMHMEQVVQALLVPTSGPMTGAVNGHGG